MSRKDTTCYWCGEEGLYSEHVPPRSLFPKDKRDKPTVIPSCFEHNNAFSKIDEINYILMQMASDTPLAEQAFDDRGKRSLLAPEAKGLKLKIITGATDVETPVGKMKKLLVNPTETNAYFEKITRGIHYHLLKKPFKGQFLSGMRQALAVKGITITDDHIHRQHFKMFLPILLNSKDRKQGSTPYPEIFRYDYVSMKEEAGEAFIIALKFYDATEVIGVLSCAKM